MIPATTMKRYYVYIMTNHARTLYVGMTNDLQRRVCQHKRKDSNFTSRYKIDKLVHYEEFIDVRDAISREKQIKGWLRVKKIELIEADNPGWSDLSEGWFDSRA
jgi:putative endonuclease